MMQFKHIRARAEKRKGGAKGLAALTPAPVEQGARQADG